MQQRTDAAGAMHSFALTRWQNVSTWNDVITAILKYAVISEIWLHKLHKNNLAKFHSDQIWNNRALGFFWRELLPTSNKMSSDMGSVPDPKN